MHSFRYNSAQMPQRQQGVVLVTALVFLVILTLLGITSMSTNTLEERMAANSQDINRAFQAAETGIAQAFSTAGTFGGTTQNYTSSTSNVSLGTFNASMDYGSTYRSPPQPITFQNIDNAASAGTFQWHFFDVDSTGTTASGAQTTIGVGARIMGT